MTPLRNSPVGGARALGKALGVLVLLVGSLGAPLALAAPPGQTATASGPTARVSYLRTQPASGLFGAPRATAYVQVYDRADPPLGRTAVAGLPASAFSAAEDGAPVSIAVSPVAPDEPLAMVVIADTSTGRGWLVPGPKYPDPLLYLRDAALRVLKEFPTNGRYAVYTMASGPAGTPPLADRTSAENAAQQLHADPDARLLERLEQAVEALKSAPVEWRRVIVVLSDGNSAFGRSYELVQGAAAQAHVAVFSVGTLDPDNPFLFLDRMGQETGGQAWLFNKTDLQPAATSPVLLDLLVDQVVKSIKSAYRLEYPIPGKGSEQRQLVVTVKTPAGEVKTAPIGYRVQPSSGVPMSTLLLAIGLPLLAVAAGAGYYSLRLRPVKTDYYLVGHGPSAGHIPEQYLYTNWRPLGRGGRGYQLTPEDPHFTGISKTHAHVRVHNLRRVKGPTGHVQTVGTVEVRAGKPSSGVGLNTSFVYNEITGVRPLSERPYQLQTGDLLILQPASRQGDSLNGLPNGVYLRLGNVGGTATESGASQDVDEEQTIAEPADADRTIVEAGPVMITPAAATPTGPRPAGSIPANSAARVPPAADLSDKTQVGMSVPLYPPGANGGGPAERR